MSNVEFRPADIKSTVDIDDLEKIDIRVGTVVAVSDIEGSKSLMKLLVDFGDHQRQILAGIKQEREHPQLLVGVQSLFVVNLRPRTMVGEVSEGMMFDIGYADGLNPAIAQPEKAMPNGARAG